MEGKDVFALLVIDMSEEQTMSDGKKWLSTSWPGYSNILQLAEKIPVTRVFDSRLQFDPAQPQNSLRVLYPNIGLQNTPGAQLVGDLKSLKATTVKKTQYSSLFQSEIEQKLKSENVTCVILTGIQTDFCIFATALDAFNLGLKVLIVKDACMSQSGPAGQRRGLSDALRFLGSYCRVVSTPNALKAVEAHAVSVLGAANEL